MNTTPIIKFKDFYIKREDQNTTGSAKDRAIKKQVEALSQNNIKDAVISSTGNAAISALHFCKEFNINLTVFLSPKIDRHKLSLIEKYSPNIIFSQKPISDAFKYSKKNNFFYLRQSTDPVALEGYKTISEEILEQLPQVTSIFIPVGSGTTLLGISQSIPNNIKIFAVQPANHAPIASYFDNSFIPESISETDALSVKLLPLKNKIINSIKEHDGFGLVMQNSNLIIEQKILLDNKIETSPEGAMCIAAIQKAKKLNMEIGNFPLVVFTGAKR